MFVNSIPDQMFIFMNQQFVRFPHAREHIPSEYAMNEIGDFVLEFAISTNYLRHAAFKWRLDNPQTGLNDSERLDILAPLEHLLKIQLKENINYDQIHLAAWAALMWCWSDDGGRYVNAVQENRATPACVPGSPGYDSFTEALYS